MKVIKPEEKYLQSYYEACVETWGHVHDNYIIHNPKEFDDWKNHIFQDYENSEKGINLPEDYVPSTTYWIVDNEEYIGTINFRQKLNDWLKTYGGHAGFFIRLSKRKQNYAIKAVKFIFQLAKELKINPLLLTCEEDNIASQHIFAHFKAEKIENDTVILRNHQTKVRRYYFNIL